MSYNKFNFSNLLYVTGSFYPLCLKWWKSLKTMVYDVTLLFIRMFWHAAVCLSFTLYKFWVKMKIKVDLDKSDNCSCIKKSNAFVQQCFSVYRHYYYKVLQNEWSLKFSTHKNRLPIQWWHAIFRFSMQSLYNRVVAVTAEWHGNLHFHCDDLCYLPTLRVSYTTHCTAKKIRRLICCITFFINFCALFSNRYMAFRLGIESLFFVGTKLEGGWFYCEETQWKTF